MIMWTKYKRPRLHTLTHSIESHTKYKSYTLIGNVYDFVLTYTRYWDTVLEISWPRFTYVVQLNVDSVSNTDPQKLGVIDIRPHYVRTVNSFKNCIYFAEHTQYSDYITFNLH